MLPHSLFVNRSRSTACALSFRQSGRSCSCPPREASHESASNAYVPVTFALVRRPTMTPGIPKYVAAGRPCRKKEDGRDVPSEEIRPARQPESCVETHCSSRKYRAWSCKKPVLFTQSAATEKNPTSLANSSHSAQPDGNGDMAARPRQAGASGGDKTTSPVDVCAVSLGRTMLV
eukprot:scaffold11629_cov131-Isochrysis_galbana.AAC.13